MSIVFRKALFFSALVFAIHCKAQTASEQEGPVLLRKAFFGVDAGVLNYPFSNNDLPPGYQVKSIQIPPAAARLTLFGYQFTKNLSAAVIYMRPVQWVVFKDLNGDELNHSVWMNVGEFSLNGNIPVSQKWKCFAEGGYALITRNGFDVNNQPIIEDASYGTVHIGGGFEYDLNSKWHLNLRCSYSPGKQTIKQPHTIFVGSGFTYHLNAHQSNTTRDQTNLPPDQLLQFSYTTNSLGYGVNKFFAEGKVPVFWGGLAKVQRGVAINYTRNILRTRKTFSLDIGGSAGNWESNDKKQSFYAMSVYPVMRFNLLKSKLANYYFFYSVAGPTYISKIQIDGYNTGRHFTFRDFMGIGSYFGHRHLMNAEVNIGHFSNGNLFPDNAAVKIPLSFSVGYAF